MPSSKPPQQQRAADWSDGETSALIGVWGPLYQRRRSRRLAVGEWRAAASAVNAHRAALERRSNRTRAQCQRRVQSLKARYKAELSRRPPSGWRHFPRLRAFLASPADGPPPGFPSKALPRVKEEEEEVTAFLASLTGGAPPGSPAKAPASVKEEEEAFLASLIGGAPPGFPAKALASVKKEAEEEEKEEKEEAFLGSPIGGAPPGIPGKAPASVKKEEEGEEVVPVCGMAAASWTVPTRRPRNESPGCCAAAVVTKLAEAYRSVELARLDLEKHKMERYRWPCWTQ